MVFYKWIKGHTRDSRLSIFDSRKRVWKKDFHNRLYIKLTETHIVPLWFIMYNIPISKLIYKFLFSGYFRVKSILFRHSWNIIVHILLNRSGFWFTEKKKYIKMFVILKFEIANLYRGNCVNILQVELLIFIKYSDS